MNMFANAHPDDEEWHIGEVKLEKQSPTPIITFGGRLDVHFRSWDSVLKLATALQEAHFRQHNRKVPTT